MMMGLHEKAAIKEILIKEIQYDLYFQAAELLLLGMILWRVW